MDYIIWILLGIALFILFIAIVVNKTSDFDGTTPTGYRPHQQKSEYHPLPPQINDEPILSTHARERMEQRLGIYSSQQEEMMQRAFKYGRTSNRSTGDLKAKLESTENKYDEPTVAKFYNGAIFIFSEEDNVLKTVYKYDPNRYLN